MVRRANLTAATRERVLQAALALIVDVGPDATTLQAVAERADVAPGTIYYHFASRDQLLAAAYDMLRLDWEARAEWVTDETDPPAQIRSMVRSLAKDYQNEEGMLNVILRIRGSDELDEAVRRVRMRRRAVIVDILTEADRAGLLRLPLPRAIAMTYGLTSFAAWQSLVEDQEMPADAVAGELSEFLIHALFPWDSR